MGRINNNNNNEDNPEYGESNKKELITVIKETHTIIFIERKKENITYQQK